MMFELGRITSEFLLKRSHLSKSPQWLGRWGPRRKTLEFGNLDEGDSSLSRRKDSSRS